MVYTRPALGRKPRVTKGVQIPGVEPAAALLSRARPVYISPVDVSEIRCAMKAQVYKSPAGNAATAGDKGQRPAIGVQIPGQKLSAICSFWRNLNTSPTTLRPSFVGSHSMINPFFSVNSFTAGSITRRRNSLKLSR